jgi:hypothetical protein
VRQFALAIWPTAENPWGPIRRNRCLTEFGSPGDFRRFPAALKPGRQRVVGEISHRVKRQSIERNIGPLSIAGSAALLLLRSSGGMPRTVAWSGRGPDRCLLAAPGFGFPAGSSPDARDESDPAGAAPNATYGAQGIAKDGLRTS